MNRLRSHTMFLALFSFIFILTASFISAEAQTPQQIAKKAFPSVVLLIMEDANGQAVSLGSGFFVRKGVIASNLHVVEGAYQGYAKVVGQKTKLNIEGSVGIDSERDLVLLKVAAPHPQSLLLGDSNAVEVGEQIYAVGNPQGLEGTFSQGIISSIREVGSDKLLQITASISPGSSGGPVLNSKGEVIGISVATFTGGQNLNFAIPSNYLNTLLSKRKPLEALTGAKQSGKQRSVFADLGGKSTESIMGDNFAWSNQLYESDGHYTFTLRNRLREPVTNVSSLVIFYDINGSPLDTDVLHYCGVIPAGLGKRHHGSVDSSIKRLTTPPSSDSGRLSSFTPATRVEFRILNFEVLNNRNKVEKKKKGKKKLISTAELVRRERAQSGFNVSSYKRHMASPCK